MTVFAEGSTPTLEEVLQTRENRAHFQKQLCEKYPEGALISFKCNIPGPVKNNAAIKRLFESGKKDIQNMLLSHGIPVVYFKEMDVNTGPECFMMTESSPISLKKIMIKLENQTERGRLFDIDILHQSGEGVKSVSRTELGFSLRKCLICTNDAKSCGRNRTHSLEEIYLEMERIIRSDTGMSF